MAKFRNPNGYGSVVKLSGNRRRPYVVRKTAGFDDRAYPIYDIIGYYASRSEAMMALANYNSNPYDINLANSTFSQLYEKFSTAMFPSMGTSLVYAHKAAYKHCEKLFDLKYKELKPWQMQEVINNCNKSHSTQINIRNLFIQMDKFAYDMEVISRMASTNLVLTKAKDTKQRQLFLDEEVKLLWDHLHEPCVDEALVMLYTGCRMTEMLTFECANISIENGTITGGIKTKNGKNRVIPIHSQLLPIIKYHMSDNKYLFPHVQDDKSILPVKTYFGRQWTRHIQEELGLQHNTHDCRHTFRSKLDSAGANKVAIDLIMGHKSSEIGERIYTHKTIDELKTAIEKLSYGL